MLPPVGDRLANRISDVLVSHVSSERSLERNRGSIKDFTRLRVDAHTWYVTHTGGGRATQQSTNLLLASTLTDRIIKKGRAFGPEMVEDRMGVEDRMSGRQSVDRRRQRSHRLGATVGLVALVVFLLPAGSVSAAATAESRGLEEAIEILSGPDSTHEELNGLAMLYAARWDPAMPLPTTVSATGASLRDALSDDDLRGDTLDSLSAAGIIPPQVAAAISAAGRNGLSDAELEALAALAQYPGSLEGFGPLARAVVGDRWDSMDVRIEVASDAGAPIVDADVSLLYHGTEIASAKTAPDGSATFRIPYSPERQNSDMIALRTFGFSVRDRHHGDYLRTGIPWARGQWTQIISLDGTSQVEHLTHAMLLRESNAKKITESRSMVPVASSTSMCNGWTNTSHHPGDTSHSSGDYDIKIAKVQDPENLGTPIQSVTSRDFKLYAKEVLPSEWFPTWTAPALRSGGLAIKQYAWYRGLTEAHPLFSGQCWDVKDSIDFQRWIPGSTHTSTDAAIDFYWNWEMKISGSWFEPRYWSGYSSDSCGTGANGSSMRQYGTQACGNAGKSTPQIVSTYYYNGGNTATVSK